MHMSIANPSSIHIYSPPSLISSSSSTSKTPQKWRCPKWAFVVQILLTLINLNRATSSSSSDPLVQQELDKVLQLPGQTFNISFAHYAGYVTVNEYTGRALFYWLIEAAEDPSSKPLVLWLNGGRLLPNTLYRETKMVNTIYEAASKKNRLSMASDVKECCTMVFLSFSLSSLYIYIYILTSILEKDLDLQYCITSKVVILESEQLIFNGKY
uniref:Uncharacterized protein n=1 Tax=Vitis vinifera TaxID=29760 RepID=F6HYM0_VITVI